MNRDNKILIATVLLVLIATIQQCDASTWRRIYKPDGDAVIRRMTSVRFRDSNRTQEVFLAMTRRTVGTSVLLYIPALDSLRAIGSLRSTLTYCDQFVGYTASSAESWIDYSSFLPQHQLISTWHEYECQMSYSDYALALNSCTLQEFQRLGSIYPRPLENQTFFFHPSDSTVLYQLDTLGLRIIHQPLCPSAPDTSLWRRLKFAKGASLFSINDERPADMFLGAADTLWHSSDAGATWTSVAHARARGLDAARNSSVVLMCASDSSTAGVYFSKDSGGSFSHISSHAANAVVFDGAHHAIYAGADTGIVLRSDDSGRTMYTYWNAGSTQPVIGCQIDAAGKLLCATTDGLFEVSQSSVAPVLLTPKNDTTWIPQPIYCSWSGITEARAYRLQLATDSAFANLVVDDSVFATQRLFDSTLIPNMRYYWRVMGELASPATSEWSSVGTFVTRSEIPPHVQLLEPRPDTLLQNTRVEFRWSPPAPAVTRYCFEIADNISFNNSLIDSSHADTTHILYEPLIAKQYWWRVKAKSAAGWGDFAETRHFWFLDYSDVRDNNRIMRDDILTSYPEPFSSSTTINISSLRGDVRIDVFDALGRRVASETLGGRSEFIFDAAALPSGAYVCSMQSPFGVVRRILTLLR